MIKAEFKIALENPKAAYEAIKVDSENTERFKVELSTTKSELCIKIDAQDITAARQAINSYLRLINTLKEVEKING